jgi:Zn-dependent protease
MEAAVLISVLIMSVVVHEVAHAWQARREGDDTADKLGRITLNPIPHLDPVGSVIVPLVLHFTGSGFLFGWARPVPVDPRNYRSYVAGDIRVSLAGIVSNLALALLATLGMAIVVKTNSLVGLPSGVMDTLMQGLYFGLWINLILAFFNLIPIPPLDGSHVLAHALPPKWAHQYRLAGRYGILILMGIMFVFDEAFRLLLGPVDYLIGLADLFVRLWI